MACTAKASHALLFMQRCRSSHVLPKAFPRRHASSPSINSSTPEFSRAIERIRTESTKEWRRPKAAQKDRSSDLDDSKPAYSHPLAQSGVTNFSEYKPPAWTSFKMIFGHRPRIPTGYEPAPFNVYNNPYRARKHWPPEVLNLDPKHQFHFEKIFRRRSLIRYKNPRWRKFIKLLINFLIGGVIIWAVFFGKLPGGPEPFADFRASFFRRINNLGKNPDDPTYIPAPPAKEDASKSIWESVVYFYQNMGNKQTPPRDFRGVPSQWSRVSGPVSDGQYHKPEDQASRK